MGFQFTNCEFQISSKEVVRFSKSMFHNCNFVGSSGDFNVQLPTLILKDCIVFKSEFNMCFRALNIAESVIDQLNDKSDAKIFQITSESKLSNSVIKGRCKNLIMSDCLIEGQWKGSKNVHKKAKKKAIWDKEIQLKADCSNTVFRQINVNPYYLTTKCHDKSSLDLSDANLVDNWSTLRKEYSGLSLFIVFLLTLFFLLPLLTKSFVLTLAAKTPLMATMDSTPLYQLLLFGGETGIYAIINCILTLFLLTYNLIRVYLTISIAKLREEENFLADSNYQITSISPNKYRMQWKLHRLMRYFLIISILYSIYKIFVALSIEVPSIL